MILDDKPSTSDNFLMLAMESFPRTLSKGIHRYLPFKNTSLAAVGKRDGRVARLEARFLIQSSGSD